MPSVPTLTRLPDLAWAELFDRLAPAELFETSLINKTVFNLAKRFRIKAEVDIEIEGRCIRIIIRTCKGLESIFTFNDPEFTGQRAHRVFDSCFFQQCYRARNTLGFTNGMDSVLNRLFSLYSIQKLKSVKITEGTVEKTQKSDLDVVLQVHKLRLKTQKKTKNKVAEKEGKLTCEHLELNGKFAFVDTLLVGNFMEGLEVTEFVEVNGPVESSHPTMFSARRLCLSENFKDTMAYVYDVIFSEELLVQNSESTDYSFNALVKLWLDGKMPNLKVLELHVDNTVEGDQMDMDVLYSFLPMVDGRSRVPKNEYVTEASGRIIDCRLGRDVQRHDGSIGTIVRRPGYFAFVAWN